MKCAPLTGVVIAIAVLMSSAGASTTLAAGTSALSACSQAQSSKTTADGSVFVLGTTADVCNANSTNDRQFFIKLTRSGSLDRNWSDGGLMVLPPDQELIAVDQVPRGWNIDADGRLSYATSDALYRLGPDGAADAGFGTGGEVAGVSASLNGLGIARVAFDSGGRATVLGGNGYSTYGFPTVIARYGSTGTLDPDFGSRGTATPVVPSATFQSGAALTVDRSGRTTFVGTDGNQVGAMRLLPGGDPDSSFGPGGDGYAKATVPEPVYAFSQDVAYSVNVGTDGLIRIQKTDRWATSGYCGFSSQSALGDTGLPVPGQTGVVGCRGPYTPVGTDAMGQPDSSAGEHAERRFRVWLKPFPASSQELIWGATPRISPGASGAYGLEHVPDSGTLVATGFANGLQLAKKAGQWRYLTHLVVMKLNDSDGTPVRSFGHNGLVILPVPRCAHGKGQTAAPDAWPHCRIGTPRISGNATVRGRARPGVVIRLSLTNSPARPQNMTRSVALTIPRSIRMRSTNALRKRVAVRVPDNSPWDATTRVVGRTIRIEGVVGPWPEESRTVNLRVTIRRGAFRRIPSRLRVSRLRMPVVVTNTAPKPSSAWFTKGRRATRIRLGTG